MNVCQNCGSEIGLDDLFCENCGFQLKSKKDIKKMNSPKQFTSQPKKRVRFVRAKN